jgi:hypothetical protein
MVSPLVFSIANMAGMSSGCFFAPKWLNLYLILQIFVNKEKCSHIQSLRPAIGCAKDGNQHYWRQEGYCEISNRKFHPKS